MINETDLEYVRNDIRSLKKQIDYCTEAISKVSETWVKKEYCQVRKQTQKELLQRELNLKELEMM